MVGMTSTRNSSNCTDQIGFFTLRAVEISDDARNHHAFLEAFSTDFEEVKIAL